PYACYTTDAYGNATFHFTVRLNDLYTGCLACQRVLKTWRRNLRNVRRSEFSDIVGHFPLTLRTVAHNDNFIKVRRCVSHIDVNSARLSHLALLSLHSNIRKDKRPSHLHFH